MTTSNESLTLTNTLLSSIRLQRHLGVRILVSTQEPTISPALLDLCSMTIIHRFTSPWWLKALKSHVAFPDDEPRAALQDDQLISKDLFGKIVSLRTGEALIFSPTAMIAPEDGKQDSQDRRSVLGRNYIKVKVRARLSADGGMSIIAD